MHAIGLDALDSLAGIHQRDAGLFHIGTECAAQIAARDIEVLRRGSGCPKDGAHAAQEKRFESGHCFPPSCFS